MNFKMYSYYYDLLYSEKEYDKESEYILNILNAYSNNVIGSILELGGGSGRHAQFLTQSGIDVFGIELSLSMVELAEGLNLERYTIKLGDIKCNNYPGFQFDCAISLFHVISYLTTNEDIITCFEAVNQQLKKGALFVFDVWFTPAFYNLKPETRVRKMENDICSIVRLAESSVNAIASTVDVNYSIYVKPKNNENPFELNETHTMRHFTYNEILLISEKTGFELVHKEEFMTGSEPSVNTWGVLFVLRKK